MKRFLSIILTFVIITSAICFSSCEKGEESEAPKADNSGKYYIVAENFEEIAFDVENKVMTITEYSSYAPLNRKIVFEDGLFRVTNSYEGEELEHTTVYNYTKTDGKITAFSTNGIEASIEYDEKGRTSKINYACSDQTYVYSFSYDETGIMTISCDVKKDLNIYSHSDYPRLLCDYKITAAEVKEGELAVTGDDREAVYPLYEVSKEEYELFSIYNVMDFIREVHLTFDRGFVFRY